jgi:hypothetical protein
MVEFETFDDQLHLIYSPRDGASWVHDRFENGKTLVIKGTFHLGKIHVVDELPRYDDFDVNERSIRFVVGGADGEYFRLNSDNGRGYV